jgi:hypothetical protein
MKKIILFTVVFNLFHQVFFAQTSNWIWAKEAIGSGPGTLSEEGLSCAIDAFGNVYAVGGFKESFVAFGSSTLSMVGNSDMFLVKYDQNGNVIWARGAGGIGGDAAAFSVAVDPSGNIVVSGEFTSPTISFGAFTLTNTGSDDIFIVKYDTSGNVLFAKSGKGSKEENGYSISTDVAGSIYVTGYFASPTLVFDSITLTNSDTISFIEYDVFIVKYSSTGSVLWAKSAGGGNGSINQGTSITTDASGDVIVTGAVQSPTITFGGTTLTNTGYRDMFIVKYDSNGNVIWAKNPGGYYDYGSCVKVDLSDDIYVTGSFQSPTMIFDTITLNCFGADSLFEDMFIVKYDTNGNVIWAKSAGGSSHDLGYSIALDSTGVYSTGLFESPTIVFGIDTLVYPAGAQDPLFVVKYDLNGNVICAEALASGGDDILGIATDNFGNAYIAGDFTGVNPFVLGSHTLPLIDFETFFIAKYNCHLNVGINEFSNQETITIYPNPFTLQTNIAFDREQKNITIKIADVIGKEIKTINFSGKQLTIDKGAMKEGVYFVQIINEKGNVANKKIIIQ